MFESEWLSNVALLALCGGLLAFYMALAAVWERRLLDRVLNAWVYFLAHCILLGRLLLAFRAANARNLLAGSALVVLCLAWRWRIRARDVGCAVRDLLQQSCRCLGSQAGYLPACSWIMLPTVIIAYWAIGGTWGRVAVQRMISAAGAAAGSAAIPAAIGFLLFGLGLDSLSKTSAASAPRLKALSEGIAGAARAALERGRGLLRWTDAWLAIPFWTAVGLLGVKALMGVVQLPYTYDDQAFHLPMAANILEHGHYADFFSRGVGSTAWHYYMDGAGKNVALLYFWVMSISRSDALLCMFSYGSGIVLVLATLRLCQTLGLGPRTALFAAPLAIFNYITIRQLGQSATDTIVGALLLLVFVASLRPLCLPNTVLLSLLCGLSIGTHRWTVLPYCGFFLFLYMAQALPRLAAMRAGRAPLWRARKPILLSVAACVVGVGVIGMGHLVQNARQFGNPLYPFSFTLLGWEFPGHMSATKYNSAPHFYHGAVTTLGKLADSVCTVWDRYRYDQSRSGGWDMLFLWFMLPAHVLCAALRFREPDYRRFSLRAWLGFLLIPQMYWLRYSLHFFALSAIPLGCVVERSRRWRGVVAAIVGLTAMFTVLRATFTIGVRGVVFREWVPYLKMDRMDRACFLNPSPALCTARAIHSDSLGTDVVYTDVRFSYYFWSRRFRNRVEAVDYRTEQQLGDYLRNDFRDPAVVTTVGSRQDHLLSQGQRFVCVYSNRLQKIFKDRYHPDSEGKAWQRRGAR